MSNNAINIEGFTQAYKHGVPLKNDNNNSRIYVNEEGVVINVSFPSISPISKSKKYPQFSYTSGEGSSKNHQLHQVVISSFNGSREEWVENDSPPPQSLVVTAGGKRKANEIWKQADPAMKRSMAMEAAEVDHIDNDANNYNLSNLQYMFRTENNTKG